MSNEITAYFKGRKGVAESLYQYDYGMVLVFDGIDLPATFDCYFSNEGDEEATPAIGADNRVAIPNKCLSVPGTFTVHIPNHTGLNDSEVEYVVTIKVINRAKPVDDGTEENQTAISQAIAALNHNNLPGLVPDVVTEWLEEHPEATTTVMDGSLTDSKLADALAKRLVRTYNTVADMSADAALKNGSICHTEGFYSAGDGGAAWYQVLATGSANGMDVIACGSLFAHLIKTNSPICPEMIGAVLSGICDISKFEHLFDIAKNIEFIDDYTFTFIQNSTVQSPTRIKIESKTGILVNGNGHTITMSGLAKAYLESINDRSSSGRDIFSFLAFHECEDITIKDINFVGTNAADAKNAFRFMSPRSICVAFKGCKNAFVENVNGTDILGNVVNATTADDLSTGCEDIIISNCKAHNCYENGFNIMGESVNCIIDGCASIRCGTGIEAFGDTCIIQNCLVKEAWSAGIAISGGATARNNKVIGSLGDTSGVGNGISVSGAATFISKNCKVLNNHVKDCTQYGLYVYPYTENTEVKGNLFENNNTLNTYGVANSISGTASVKTKDLIIDDNIFKSIIDDQKVFLASNVNGVLFTNNIVEHSLPSAVYAINFDGTCESFKACGNTLTKRVNKSGTPTNYFIGNNVVGKTIPEIVSD